jgi:glycerol-3-phosphate dehydrogenase
LKIHGHSEPAPETGTLAVYGNDAAKIRQLIAENPTLGEKLHPSLPYLKAEVVWATREEMARTVEDVLARRTRSLFLNARAALEMATAVADLMAPELGWDDAAKQKQLADFHSVANNYLLAR